MSTSSIPTVKTKWSPKVIVAGLAAFLAPAALASLMFLQTPEGSVLFDGLHPVLKVFVLALVVSAITTITSYLKADPLRQIGQLARDAVPQEGFDEPDSEPLPSPDDGVDFDAVESNPDDLDGDGRDDRTGRFVPRS